MPAYGTADEAIGAGDDDHGLEPLPAVPIKPEAAFHEPVNVPEAFARGVPTVMADLDRRHVCVAVMRFRRTLQSKSSKYRKNFGSNPPVLSMAALDQHEGARKRRDPDHFAQRVRP